MFFGVGTDGNFEGVAFEERFDEVTGEFVIELFVVEIAKLFSGGQVAAQGDDVFDAHIPECVDIVIQVWLCGGEEGEVRAHGDIELSECVLQGFACAVLC